MLKLNLNMLKRSTRNFKMKKVKLNRICKKLNKTFNKVRIKYNNYRHKKHLYKTTQLPWEIKLLLFRDKRKEMQSRVRLMEKTKFLMASSKTKPMKKAKSRN